MVPGRTGEPTASPAAPRLRVVEEDACVGFMHIYLHQLLAWLLLGGEKHRFPLSTTSGGVLRFSQPVACATRLGVKQFVSLVAAGRFVCWTWTGGTTPHPGLRQHGEGTIKKPTPPNPSACVRSWGWTGFRRKSKRR